MKKSVLSVKNLSVTTHDGRSLISNVSFSLHSGQSLLIQGPNGTGKTSLLRSLLGLHPHQTGQMDFSVSSDEIAFLPQMGNVRVFLPILIKDVLLFSDSDGTAIPRALEIGLLTNDELERSWNSSSGGERQKTLITRALLTRPKLLLLDEPLNHLDKNSRLSCMRALQSYVDGSLGEQGALILISHEAALDQIRIDQVIDLGGE